MGKERHCNCKLGQELFTWQWINPKLKFLSVVTFVISSLYLHIFVGDIGNRSDDQEGAGPGTQNTNIECLTFVICQKKTFWTISTFCLPLCSEEESGYGIMQTLKGCDQILCGSLYS